MRVSHFLAGSCAVLFSALLTFPASAQSVFLLQLGSYNNQEEAATQWENVKNQHPEIVQGLSLRVSEVMLPPDNFTIYRAQVGPIEYKAEATSLCKKLKEKQVSCFVVETAMYADNVPQQAARMDASVVNLEEERSTSLKEDAYAPVITAAAPAPQSAQEEFEIAKAASSVAATPVPSTASVKEEFEKELKDALEDTTLGNPQEIAPTTAVSPAETPTFEEEAPLQATASVEAPQEQAGPAVPQPEKEEAMAVEMPAIEASSAEAPEAPVIEIKQRDAASAATATEVAEEDTQPAEPAEKGLFSQLLPWLSGEDDAEGEVAQVAQAPEPLPAQEVRVSMPQPVEKAEAAAPVVQEARTSLAAVPLVEAEPVVKIVSPPAPVVFSGNASPAGSMTKPAEDEAMKTVERTAPASASQEVPGLSEHIAEHRPMPHKRRKPGAPLPWRAEQEAVSATPPPPAPTKEPPVRAMLKDVPPAPKPIAAKAAPLPLSPQPVSGAEARLANAQPKLATPQGAQEALPWRRGKKRPQPSPAPVASPKPLMPPVVEEPVATRASVSVAEAIRVPLSQDVAESAMESTVVPPAPAEFRPRALGRGATPSQNFHQRTLWAQLNYFASDRDAMNHWNALRYEFPSYFSGVRGRVTKPYSNRHTTDQVSLRVGPFLTAEEVREICALPTNTPELTCTLVKDVGASATANQPRYRPYDKAGNSMRATSRQVPGAGQRVFWVQFGSYATPGQASQAWDSMKEAQPDLLGRLEPDVYSPPLSSAPRAIFRLRTGPYVNQGMARELCSKLQWRGVDCLVLSGR